ncbi:MAG: PorP/SprF family type IX secretion system membrane protein [Crocinitomicaceae bacterium]|nr:PorP/SprF family type IX secretion system membrane protein [Crocinitomicaceae bacterium]
MKNIITSGLIMACLLISSSSFAQQTPQSNVYSYNKYSLNPAYAGASGCTEIFFSHLNQWVKVEGAPITSLFSANTRIGKSLGIGGNVLIDKLGMLQQVAASGSISYGFTIAKQHNLRFGITGGYYQFRLNPTGAIAFDVQDVIVNSGSQSSSSINSEVGLLYQFKGLELSFASKQVIQSFSNFAYNGLDGYGLRRHMLGLVGYKFQLNEKLSVKPSVLYKGINNTNQFDINADVNYKDLIHGGIGYRTQVGLIGRVGVNIQNLFFIGYAYEVPMQNIAKYSSGSHEIIIGLKLCKKQKSLPDSPYTEAPIQKVDTVYAVEYKTDTLIVERVDTIYINEGNVKTISDEDANRVLDLASRKLEFEYDKAIILKKSYGELESLTNLMLIRQDLRIRLDGHTDNNGSDEYNMTLSKNRVQAVKDMLVSNGVDASRIDLYYYGESKPIANNDTEEGQAKNRRVEMHFLK